MKKIINIKKQSSRKALAVISVVLAIVSVVMTMVWQMPVALATSLEEIKVSREVSAPIDKVWNIVQISTTLCLTNSLNSMVLLLVT
jgi:hypothetical protein